MPYQQFELKISGEPGSSFFAEVLEAPRLRRTDPTPLELPFDEIDAWRAALRRNSVTQEANLDLGKRLYRALFKGEIQRLWDISTANIGPRGGVRLRLDIRAPELFLVPWEIIHDGYTYLALSVTTPVVRCLSSHRPGRMFDRSTAPNVLVVTSSPSDTPKLPNLEAEVSAISRSFAGLVDTHRLGSYDLLSHATRRSLQYQLGRANYDIVHYIGHGVFDGHTGYLELEDESARSDRLDSVTLGHLLTDTSVDLLFLNSCETVSASSVKKSRGTAEASLAVGIPTVVAMSTVIMDATAMRFAEVFYEALVEEHSIEYCMTEARKAITNHPAYWSIPVLFTNTTPSTAAMEPGPTWVINQRGKNNKVAQNITEIKNNNLH